ncbi:accessory factor UbiK family protein [Salinispirillum sp. LH 10-3-1]|uniref:Accessory factor UbiK family protein n=1 Tax=Salinispirillum sp. LH 10-3-1 TaxID=2952525 RepID=A0AB38YH59_9GAMM
MKDKDDIKAQLMAGLSQALNQGRVLKDGMEENMQSLLQAQLAKLDVVTREEFETQQVMLRKAQAQLLQLQAQVEELQAKNKDEKS